MRTSLKALFKGTLKNGFALVGVYLLCFFCIIPLGVEVYVTTTFFLLSCLVFFVVACMRVSGYNRIQKLKHVYFFAGIPILMLVFASFLGMIRLPFLSGKGLVVGVHYDYHEWTPAETIYKDLEDIASRGFKLLRLNMLYLYLYDPRANMGFDTTDKLISKARSLGLEIYLVCCPWVLSENENEEDMKIVDEYAKQFGDSIRYYQLLNEIDNMRKFDGSYYMAGDIVGLMQRVKQRIQAHDSQATFTTSFTVLYTVRVDLIQEFGRINELVDMVGIDIYQSQGKILLPILLNQPPIGLRCLTGKEVIISELGSAETDNTKKTTYLQEGIDSAKRNGVPIVIIFSWNSDLYGVKETTLSVA